MGRFRALHALNRKDDSVDDRRRAGRILTDPVRCTAGRVLDLSSTGARFVAYQRWRVGEMREIRLSFASGENAVGVKARCAWVKRKGFFGQIVGVRFEELSDTTSLALTRIATGSAKRVWGSKRQVKDVDWEKLERQAKWKGSSSKEAA